MKRWEYDFMCFDKLKSLSTVLAERGSNGWELVYIGRSGGMRLLLKRVAIFKREKPGAALAVPISEPGEKKVGLEYLSSVKQETSWRDAV